jgi:hypothetical protein
MMRARPAVAVMSALLCAQTAPAQSPLPPGPLDLKPMQGETATVRAGGPDGFFVSRDILRCAGAQDAIVGLRTRRGSVLDYLQIVCAPVQCNGSNCGWNSYVSTSSVGDPNGGQTAALLLCAQDEVVSGYRARVKGVGRLNYVEDISVQCARISGAPTGSSVPVMQESQQGRRWIHATGHLASPQFEGICATTGTTGVAAFGGRWVTGPTVAQAMALLCGGSQGTCPAGTYTNFVDVGCKQCVALNGSTNPVTARTDIEVANLPVARYNCHFYTLTYMNYVTPSIDKGRVPRRFEQTPRIPNPFVPDFRIETAATQLTDEDIRDRYGWTQITTALPASLKQGDIVTVPQPGSNAQVHRNLHSGVVIRSGPDVVIRQKPNPDACVTDFNWTEFVRFYQATEVKGWRLAK